jgi:hypothetical protein
MAGRHGVPDPERRTHARQASGQRRSRAQLRDAAQPWRAWLAVRGVLALLVLTAVIWSALLLSNGRGGSWPVIALAAGVLSLLMIGLDVRARVRQRRRWRDRAVPPTAEPGPVPSPPTPQGRSSHRK